MGRINRLSKLALSGQETSTMLKKKKQQTTFLQQTFLGEVLRAKPSYQCWEYGDGKVKVPVLHRQITENRVSGEGKQNKTQEWVTTHQLL